MSKDTNSQIAELIMAQTYEERIDLAGRLAGAAADLLSSGNDIAELDTSYFATVLFDWAEEKDQEANEE